MSSTVLNWAHTKLDGLRTNLWLVPVIMFVTGAALALLMLKLSVADQVMGIDVRARLGGGSGEDARNLLSTLLTAVISLAGIVFSVTVVALSLAANAYGPRLIRTFRADRSTQFALGTFALTIVYLLLVLQAVRGEAAEDEVQTLAVTVGGLLAFVCVIALIAFLQGVSSLIVADEVVRRVRREFDDIISKLPEFDGSMPDAERGIPDEFKAQSAPLALPKEGYVQSIDIDGIMTWAVARDAVVRVDVRPGDFVVDGDHKVHIYPDPDNPEAARRELGRFIVSGPDRTPDQDFEFALRHLVEVALRALSPGINDPFTAIAVIDRLRGGIARLGSRRMPPGLMYDDAGNLRLIRRVNDYKGVVDAAFNQIRQSAVGKPAVLIHMLETFEALSEHLRTEEQRVVLRHHAGLVRSAQASARNASDDADLDQAYRRTVAALSLPPSTRLR